MNCKDCVEYWRPAARKLFPEVKDWHESKALLLDEKLGVHIFINYINRPVCEDFSLPDDMKQLLKALAGPHGQTILKMYRIQKGLDE